MELTKKRDFSIDVLRVIGIMLIVLAHVNPPTALFQLRTFDVPLMVFVSGMAYYISGKDNVKILPYAISRFRRLVLPVWAFLVIFFSAIYLAKIDVFQSLIESKKVIFAFMLYDFGYVWIIRVFLIIALLSPFYVKLANRFNLFYFIVFDAAISFLYLSLPHSDVKLLNALLIEVVIPAISYGVMFIIGYKVSRLQSREINQLLIFTICLFAVQAVYYFFVEHKFFGPQNFKYPPTIYYISYAIAMIFVLRKFVAIFLDKFKEDGALGSFIKFVSMNTIWIYLWHIPIVAFFHMGEFKANFVIEYLIAFVIPLVVVFFQRKLVTYATRNNPGYSRIVKDVFTG